MNDARGDARWRASDGIDRLLGELHNVFLQYLLPEYEHVVKITPKRADVHPHGAEEVHRSRLCSPALKPWIERKSAPGKGATTSRSTRRGSEWSRQI